MSDTDEQMAEFLEGVVGVVDASSFESLCLWREYHEELKKPWVQNGAGFMEIVGHLADMPVCLSLFTNIVDGHRILFVDPTSQVVDHRMVDAWLEKTMPASAREGNRINRADAMNFHNVMHAARRMSGAK